MFAREWEATQEPSFRFQGGLRRLAARRLFIPQDPCDTLAAVTRPIRRQRKHYRHGPLLLDLL